MYLDGRLIVRIPEELKAQFKQMAEVEGYERLSTALRDVVREVVQRGYVRSPGIVSKSEFRISNS